MLSVSTGPIFALVMFVDFNWLHFGLFGDVLASLVIVPVFAYHVILGKGDYYLGNFNGSLKGLGPL